MYTDNVYVKDILHSVLFKMIQQVTNFVGYIIPYYKRVRLVWIIIPLFLSFIHYNLMNMFSVIVIKNHFNILK